MENENTLVYKESFREKLTKFFKKKFNIFAFLSLLLSLLTFIVMIYLESYDIAEAVNYIADIVKNPEEDLRGYHIFFSIKPFFYLLMYNLQIILAIYGIIVLFKYSNERTAFKIIFRSIFYICGLMLIVDLLTFIVWLIAPLKDIRAIGYAFFGLLILEVAIGGRFVSNFRFVNIRIRSRKFWAHLTIFFYICICGYSLYLEVTPTEDLPIDYGDIFFYSLQLITAIFSIFAVAFFNDDLPLRFEPEPKPKHLKVEAKIDIPDFLKELTDHQFSKNTKLTAITIPDGIKTIPNGAFANCLRVKCLSIPKSVNKIELNAFFNCSHLKTIKYAGSRDEFNQIDLDPNWLNKVDTNIIHCNDGDINIY